MIHIGKIIEEEMLRQERTPAWLARKINCARPNIYYIFRQESINTDLLLRISKALNHNFFRYYSEEVYKLYRLYSIYTKRYNLYTRFLKNRII